MLSHFDLTKKVPEILTQTGRSLKIYWMDGNAGNSFSRRAMLKAMLGAAAAVPLSRLTDAGSAASGEPQSCSLGLPAPTHLSDDDERFLEDVEKENFLYFWEQASPQTGMVKDRCKVNGQDHTIVASIAATGFGLTAL
ncbi:MAG: hypothetical protein WB662_07920, partial [Methyloceanibacter sp.]